jgi:hypothetical protein
MAPGEETRVACKMVWVVHLYEGEDHHEPE